MIGLLALCLSTGASAASQGGFSDGDHSQGGFKGPSEMMATVASAKEMRDDHHVILEGHISKQINEEHYLFEDKTGNIIVEIDHHKWRGQTVTPKDMVRLSGEVDKDWNSVQVEVDKVQLLK